VHAVALLLTARVSVSDIATSQVSLAWKGKIEGKKD
jgi:hypothetical protein